jgi:hypothetical protein
VDEEVDQMVTEDIKSSEVIVEGKSKIGEDSNGFFISISG